MRSVVAGVTRQSGQRPESPARFDRGLSSLNPSQCNAHGIIPGSGKGWGLSSNLGPSPVYVRRRRVQTAAVTGADRRPPCGPPPGQQVREVELVELVVFDWDGTVVDSIGHITTSWRLAFSEFYYQALREQNSRDRAPPPVPSETWIKQCIGLSVDSTINKYLPNASTWERHVITEAYRKHFRAGAGNTAYLPGAEAGLRQLVQLGYTLAVATGKSRRGLDFELELLGTEGLFLTTRTADCTKSKPHPQMLLEIIDDADSVASRTLMVGDSCVDMRMAERADVAGIAVTFGAEPREALVATRPLFVADNWDELMHYFLTTCAPFRR